MSDRKFEIYKLAFQHNDEEARVLWQKNSAFLIANSSFLFAVSILRENQVVALLLSILGLGLAVTWLQSNRRSYSWLLYWIRELQRLEKDLGDCDLWSRAGSLEGKKQGRPSLRFASHGSQLAGLFLLAWVALLAFFALGLVPK